MMKKEITVNGSKIKLIKPERVHDSKIESTEFEQMLKDI